MHLAYTSAQVAEQRRQKSDDVKKRAQFRKAHGLEDNDGKLGGWTARDELSPQVAIVPENVAQEKQETFVDFEGKEQPLKKKWFGIW